MRANKQQAVANRRGLHLSWAEQRLAAEALLSLCGARFLLQVLPFRWIAPSLGQRMTVSPLTVGAEQERLASRVEWAIQGIVRHVPIRFVCLPQAVAARWMLRRRGIPSTLYLGLARGQHDTVQAHAWLRVGQRILTGGRESAGHQIIATFGP